MAALLNAFSVSMLPPEGGQVSFRQIDVAGARASLVWGVQSYVGHADTAAVFAAALGRAVPVNRASYTLPPYEEAVVGQYSGPRLPEGATALPEGAEIRWYLISRRPTAQEDAELAAATAKAAARDAEMARGFGSPGGTDGMRGEPED